MTEDDQYRSSTQFRLWSFTPEQLATQRVNTNKLASERVRAAFKRRRENKSAGSNGAATDPDCLTVEEEAKLLEFYCYQCTQLAQAMKVPINVTATAVQFLRRFYLYNSPMTYHPNQITSAAFFLATKTENHHIPLRDLASKLAKTSPEDIIAPEFIITQALRFTFDVRHPHRALRGGYLELLTIADGTAQILPGSPETPASLRSQLAKLPAREGDAQRGSEMDSKDVTRRLEAAYGRSSEYLKNAAILSDAYFLYTPSQIWLAALLIADAPLFHFYLGTKFPAQATEHKKLQNRIFAAISACAELLRRAAKVVAEAGQNRLEAMDIDKKLYQCRNPDKADLVGLNKAVKRDEMVDGKLDESVAKRRKLEREKSEKEAEDIFGGDLKKPG